MNRVFTASLGLEREKWQKIRLRIGECTALAVWLISPRRIQNGASNRQGAKRNKVVQSHEGDSVRYTVASSSPPVRKAISQVNRMGDQCFMGRFCSSILGG
jgi:hypothetical protein